MGCVWVCGHHTAIFVLRKLELSLRQRERNNQIRDKYTLCVFESVRECVCVYTYLRLSLCVLYSMMVLGGRFRTRRSVSLMRDVVT